MFSTRIGRPTVQELEMTKLRGQEYPFLPEPPESEGMAHEWFALDAMAADLSPDASEPQKFWTPENVGLTLWVLSSIALAATVAYLSVWGG